MRARSIAALLGLIASPFASTAQLHWTQSARFEPTDDAIRGIPASALNPEWRKVSLLSYETMPEEAERDLESMRKAGLKFALRSDLDGDSIVEETVVGVFETEDSERGNFVAVLAAPTSDSRIQAVLVERLSGEGGFYALQRFRGGIAVLPCTACDLFAVLRFEDGEWALGAQ